MFLTRKKLTIFSCIVAALFYSIGAMAQFSSIGKIVSQPMDAAQQQTQSGVQATQLGGADAIQGSTSLADALGGGEATDLSSSVDVGYMLYHIQEQLPQLVRFIVALSYVSGIGFFYLALMKLKQKGMQTSMSQTAQEGYKTPIIYFSVGSALLYFPSFVHMATNSFIVSGGDSIYGYAAASSSLSYQSFFMTMAAIVRLIGYISFLRGWWLLAKMGGHSAQPGQLSKGMMHIVAGVLAVNIVTSYQIVKATLGLGF